MKRPWTCLYTKPQLLKVTGALGIPDLKRVPRKGEGQGFFLRSGVACSIEWTEHKSDSGKRLYRLTQISNKEKKHDGRNNISNRS